MTSFDIIPDIHGQSAKLHRLLGQLGWQKENGSWRSPEPDRQIVFLGDFIDRGPNNAEVLRTVRELVDSGRARAIMGNHELNAIHFHTLDADTGKPARPHIERNRLTHETFLAEFPVGSRQACDAIGWFKTLPLWLDLGPFRAVHACWSDGAVQRLRDFAPDGVLPAERLIAASRKNDPLYEHVDLLAKGPEVRLPEGMVFTDGAGQVRDEVRLAWWRKHARTWRDAVVSVPNPQELPDNPVHEATVGMLYPEDAKPVFFGHYWLTGPVEMEAPNALCLDYSAGRDGSLVAYRFSRDTPELSLSNIVGAS